MSKAIQKLIRKGEGTQLDFKMQVHDPYRIAKTISSFANHLGGTLLVGVRDDGTITGVDAEEEKYVLDQASQQLIVPPVALAYEVVEDEEWGLTVLKVDIEPSDQRPHYALQKNGDRTLYIRERDRSLPASEMVEKRMLTGTYQALPAPEQLPPDPLGQQLVRYVNRHDKITVKAAMQECNLSRRRAQRALLHLEQDGYLRSHDHEKEVYYTR